ncbi:MAG: YbfB/YjiJ family MFS transporter [Burkholderiales bacterium]
MTEPRPPGRWATGHEEAPAWLIALAGAVSLAVAMGIGRFAFTPLLPMMLHDGVIDLHGASWLASANYLGYLTGALLCTFQPWIWARMPGLPGIHAPWMVRAGLVATVLLTLGMAVPVSAVWPLLRFAAGVASAVVFVYTSGWCLSRLARMNAAAMGGAIYTGPGAGIVVSGVFASGMVQWGWQAQTGWLVFGVLAFVLTALVWRTFQGATPAAPAAAASIGDGRAHGGSEIACLAAAYGVAGFGYIVTATFLPVIARQALPGSPWLDMFWPVFGAGVMIGALLATRLRMTLDMRLLLAACYFVQATGIAIGVWSPSLAGFAIGSLLLGIPFTAITFFAMQEVRRLRPQLAASFMGLLTVLYGLGQIAGPPMVALILRHSRTTGEGFTLALEIAASSLLVGALLFIAMTKAWPVRR